MVEVTDVTGRMDVYLVPAGAKNHELYCEAPVDEPTAASASKSIWGRLTETFRNAVAEGEAEQARLSTHDLPRDRSRIRRAVTRRIASVVAEQRLLWRLRHEDAVRLMHPDDLTGDEAIAAARAEVASDLTKHRNWCVIDAVLTAITGPALFLVPGPNIVSWYFAFRAVGHFFAYRGAQRAVTVVKWSACSSPLLTELRRALNLVPDQRVRKVDEIAGALGLSRLSRFVAGVADRPAS